MASSFPPPLVLADTPFHRHACLVLRQLLVPLLFVCLPTVLCRRSLPLFVPRILFHSRRLAHLGLLHRLCDCVLCRSFFLFVSLGSAKHACCMHGVTAPHIQESPFTPPTRRFSAPLYHSQTSCVVALLLLLNKHLALRRKSRRNCSSNAHELTPPTVTQPLAAGT